MADAVSDFHALHDELRKVEHNQVFDYMSRWGFERMLDTLAIRIRDDLAKKLTTSDNGIGCSLFYAAGDRTRYVIGGSSTPRTNIDPAARTYTLEPLQQKSFTATSLRFGTPLAFNDFETAIKRFGNTMNRTRKECELRDTRGYLAIPGPLAAMEARTAVVDDLPNTGALADSQLPRALLRLTLADVDRASVVLSLLLDAAREVLGILFELIERGQRSLVEQPNPAELAIADLNSNLLEFRDREYAGLEALAAHLQTIFGDCECSIWRAKPVGSNTRLYLAATTALSNSPQHVMFRQHFFRDRAHYDVRRERDAKTVHAYLSPDKPVYRRNAKGTGAFPGKGEWANASSFLALAIPSRDPKRAPYGVIRLVRGESSDGGGEFLERDFKLAAAIAKTLTFWLEFFPRNDHLVVDWHEEHLKEDTMRALFALDPDRPPGDSYEAGIEFDALLQKLFETSTGVSIRESFSGFSGAAVLLVEPDDGPSVILKCARKVGVDDSPEVYADPLFHQNSITSEVHNYRRWVEGKIRLNHNVIYPERIRETRRVNGFVSSFVSPGHSQRKTLTAFASSDVDVTHLFRTLSLSVSNIVEDIWQHWYGRAISKTSASPWQFVQDGFRQGDIPWALASSTMSGMDNSVYDARIALKYRKCPEPSQTWSRFKQWAEHPEPVLWQECVMHGDLHGGNIFLDPRSGETWLIDFARTEPRTSVFDLATLEAHIKFQVLPTLLRARKVVKDDWDFIDAFRTAERSLFKQPSYDLLPLTSIASMKDKQARDALLAAMRAVTDIRVLLHNALNRTGGMNDYWIALLIQSFRYTNVRGGSDPNKGDLRLLLAALSAGELVDRLTTPTAAQVESS